MQGSRINHNGFLGTIRYVGSVDNAPGTWFGVEWDDPARGKHDGVKDDKRYFLCRASNAGSFIRSTVNLALGQTFVQALEAKYIETPHASGVPELVILGSSAGAIEVEAVNLDKVRQKLSELERLREISLDNENVSSADRLGIIQKTCPNVRGLDLSANLLPSWDEVARVARELPKLERLGLNRNRLQLPFHVTLMANAFTNLTELLLNKTMMTWPEVDMVIAMMPKLRLVEVGHNDLVQLFPPQSAFSGSSGIEILNLDSNNFQNWAHLCHSFHRYHCLQNIILISNLIEDIPLPEDNHHVLTGVRQLALSANRLTSWQAIDAIALWCPNLQNLSLNGNTLVSTDNAGHYRPLAIAKVPSLQVLDGAAITSRERTDSELFYLSQIVKEPLSDEQRNVLYPQWSRLCQVHGRPSDRENESRPETLSNQLIEITLVPQVKDDVRFTTKVLTVLPTMTLRVLRAKFLKTLKINAKQNTVSLWQRRPDCLRLLEDAENHRSLEWVGIEAGSEIVFRISSNN